MEIRIHGAFEFCDKSDCCYENGNLSILYPVPKNWNKWNNEKKQSWLDKNEGEIYKHFCQSMCVTTDELIAEDIEAVE